MSTMKEKEEELIQEFEMFDDWMDKYNYIIELGKELPIIDSQYKTEEFLISGCQSQVWLHPEIYLLIIVLSGHTPQEILDNDLSYIDAIGLKNHLSPTRSNGLASMIKQIKLYALAYSTKQ